MRRRNAVLEDEDVTGLAGWMYSDLLLGLMVVFLATISFIPAGTVANGKQDQQVAYAYARVHPVDLEGTYTTTQITKLVDDIAQFKLAQGLSTTAYVTKAQFVGSFDPDTEPNSTGIERALAFSNAVQNREPRLLRIAATAVRAAKSNTPAVTVKLTFASEVKVVVAP